MNIQIYRYKVEWYFKEEYDEFDRLLLSLRRVMAVNKALLVDEIASTSDELSDEIDNLIESAYNKGIHFPVAARKLRDVLKRYYDVSEGL